MKVRLIILLLSIVTIISCHDKDTGPTVCLPHSLLYKTDSIVFAYAGNHVTTVKYFGSGFLIKQDDFEYNSSGQLAVVAKLSLAIDGTRFPEARHVISYENGYPSEVVTDSKDGYYTTKFTHNDKGQLMTAESSAGLIHDYLGTTRYVYDENGNVPEVYYTILIFGEKKEVLARENTAFDNHDKFYSNSPEMKVANEYVYGYLPNKNNCLSSTLHYFSYDQHFSSPLEITFAADYDDEGRIKSLQSDDSGRSYSGEVLFLSAVYECH